MNLRNKDMLKHGFIILASVLLCGCMQNRQLSNTADTTLYETNIADTIGEKPVAPQRLIVAGQGIGNISINEDADSVYNKLGKPDSSKAVMNKSVASWVTKHGGVNYQTQIYCERRMGSDTAARRVKQIRVTSPGFKTMDYMGVGMHLQTIMPKKEFNLIKIGQYTEGNKQFFVYDDADAGIAFEVDRKNMCTGVIVHEPHYIIESTYLAFHTNLPGD